MTTATYSAFAALEELRLAVVAVMPDAATARLDCNPVTEGASIADLFDETGKSIPGWRTMLASQIGRPRVTVPFNALLIVYPNPTSSPIGDYTVEMDLAEPLWARALEHTREFLEAGFHLTDDELAATLKLAFGAIEVPAEKVVMQVKCPGGAATPAMLLSSKAGQERLSLESALHWSTCDPDRVNLLPWSLAQDELPTRGLREASTSIVDELAARLLSRDAHARTRAHATGMFAFEL